MITESRQKRVLLIIITILFLANIATVVMFFMGRPGKKKLGGDSRKERMHNYLKKELGYNDAQIDSYKSIAEEHKTSVDSVFENMRREKEGRLKVMASQEFSDSSIERAAVRMAESQKILEVKMLKHLKLIRALGDDRQKLKFDTGFLNYMNRNKSKNRN